MPGRARVLTSPGALRSLKTLAWGGLLGVVVATAAPFGPADGTPDPAAPRPGVASEADRPECSAALIRTASGSVRRVSFAVGWDVFTGRRPGTLIEACLDGPDGERG